MQYATQAEFIKRYDERTLRLLCSNEDGSLNTDKINESLEDAHQTIDSYLAGRYTLPLITVPAVLTRHCCYLARYFLEKGELQTKPVKIMKTVSAIWRKSPVGQSRWVSVKVARQWKAIMW